MKLFKRLALQAGPSCLDQDTETLRQAHIMFTNVSFCQGLAQKIYSSYKSQLFLALLAFGECEKGIIMCFILIAHLIGRYAELFTEIFSPIRPLVILNLVSALDAHHCPQTRQIPVFFLQAVSNPVTAILRTPAFHLLPRRLIAARLLLSTSYYQPEFIETKPGRQISGSQIAKN
ncbi:hypothetical protein H633G_11287 [Metarhizium anisopliae BRIP 53284]|nr:hypothetical protein H633G_11287 [Metarhizium anisopliae BRIP 53284]